MFVRIREFDDCIVHIRLLSWLLLGALKTMLSIPPPAATDDDIVLFQLFSFTIYSFVADRILLVLGCFAEQTQVFSSGRNSVDKRSWQYCFLFYSLPNIRWNACVPYLTRLLSVSYGQSTASSLPLCIHRDVRSFGGCVDRRERFAEFLAESYACRLTACVSFQERKYP